jgi:hypothetical protein
MNSYRVIAERLKLGLAGGSPLGTSPSTTNRLSATTVVSTRVSDATSPNLKNYSFTPGTTSAPCPRAVEDLARYIISHHPHPQGALDLSGLDLKEADKVRGVMPPMGEGGRVLSLGSLPHSLVGKFHSKRVEKM